MPERIDNLEPNPYISSPGDFLAHHVAEELREVPQFVLVFGKFIDGYLRMDYGIRNLPAIRVYQEEPYTMEADNWFIVGQLELDVILPPSLRREQLHLVSDQLTGALLQQFRRLDFFTAMRKRVPALNYLGQSITVSKNRAFQLSGEELVPLAVMSVNFRIDLREWDLYLVSQNRTTDDPFCKTLGNLKNIAAIIAALDPVTGEDAGVDQGIQEPVGP